MIDLDELLEQDLAEEARRERAARVLEREGARGVPIQDCGLTEEQQVWWRRYLMGIGKLATRLLAGGKAR
jgi:hypothetical protein